MSEEEWSTEWWDSNRGRGWLSTLLPDPNNPTPKSWPHVHAAIKKYKITRENLERYESIMVIACYADYGFTLREKEDE